MSEAKFTKEEWRVFDGFGYGYGVQIGLGGGFQFHHEMANAEANAHLIAAAPELYRAIENLLVELDSKHGISLESMIGVGLRRCLEDAYYSLAKARGEV